MRLPVTWAWSCGALASRNFRILAAGNIINVAGSAVSLVALPFAVLSTGGRPSDVGYVAAAELIPALAFLLPGGVTADRLPRHLILIAATALQALAQGSSAALLLTGHAHLAARGPGRSGGTGRGSAPASGPAAPDHPRKPAQPGPGCTGRAAAHQRLSPRRPAPVAGPGWGLAADAALRRRRGLLTTMRFPTRPPHH
jgi:MFS family permease